MSKTKLLLATGICAAFLWNAQTANAAGNPPHGSPGDQGGMHMGPQGDANTNGPSSQDRDTGRDRAEDRDNPNAPPAAQGDGAGHKDGSALRDHAHHHGGPAGAPGGPGGEAGGDRRAPPPPQGAGDRD